jgi:hypothetical protein
MTKTLENIGALALVIVSLAWMSTAQHTYHQLETAVLGAYRRWPALSRTVRTPYAGLEVLPPRVLDAVRLLRENHVKAFRLSESASKDGWFAQQTAALAWPLLPSHLASAPTLFLNEPLTPGCQPLGKANEVTLALCP